MHGFDQNLLKLARLVLDVAMSFRYRDGEVHLPSSIKAERFDACLEVLLRNYANAGMDASGFATGLRLLCLRPSMKSAFSKMKALQGITIKEFVQVMNNLLMRISVNAFYHGNVNRSDADEAATVICELLTSRHVGIPKKKLSPQLVLKMKKSINHHQVIVPTIDKKDPNTAVEVYFQFCTDDNSSHAIRQRVLVDLIELILEEPLYNQIRTKGKSYWRTLLLEFICKLIKKLFPLFALMDSEQFGYEVSCGSRWTCESLLNILAFSSSDIDISRIYPFLRRYIGNELPCCDSMQKCSKFMI